MSDRLSAGLAKFHTMTAPERFGVIALKGGLKVYANTGMKVNAAYTPTNMTRMASKLTGITYAKSRAGCKQAFEDLNDIIETARG